MAIANTYDVWTNNELDALDKKHGQFFTITYLTGY